MTNLNPVGSQKDALTELYSVVEFPGTLKEFEKRQGKFQYGYDKDLDLVIISKDGTIGEIYEIEGIKLHSRQNPKEYTRDQKRKMSNTGKDRNFLLN